MGLGSIKERHYTSVSQLLCEDTPNTPPPPPWLMKIKSNSVFAYVRIKLLFASSGSASVRDREKEPLYVQNFVPTLIEHIIDHMFWLDFVFTLFLCFFFKGKLGV